MINGENFVEELNCDELCMIAKKKRDNGRPSDKKMAKLAVKEMDRKMCEC